jgi:hypothetical protein
MARGGHRENAGRPLGARDRMPRKSARLDRLKSMSEEYDTNEYLITNETRIFGGNALELITAMYKAEELPVRVRLYAAAKAVEFESDKSARTLEDIKEQVRREMASEGEGGLERLVDEIKRHRKVIIEARDQQLRAWVDSGQLNAEQAALVRGMWADVDEDAPFHINDLAMPDGGWRNGHGKRHVAELTPPRSSQT